MPNEMMRIMKQRSELSPLLSWGDPAEVPNPAAPTLPLGLCNRERQCVLISLAKKTFAERLPRQRSKRSAETEELAT